MNSHPQRLLDPAFSPGEDFRLLLSDEHGVLEVRGIFAVAGDDNNDETGIRGFRPFPGSVPL